MTSRLLHYSRRPLGPLRSVPSEEQDTHPTNFLKPAGLWLSVEGEDDWLAWCRGANFNLESFAYVTEIKLAPRAKVLWIRNAAALDRFHRRYVGSRVTGLPATLAQSVIDWSAVAQKYDGIIIAPYIWSRRLDGLASRWYYGWDCSSGCIWNAEAMRARPSKPIRPARGKRAAAE